ncbi:MAG: hypothetical protein EOP10_01370 [Proteobacteria bacterium]|nr:MAG: hypothetical protein EOP10_01370 [Pseudomonadota bacterium]
MEPAEEPSDLRRERKPRKIVKDIFGDEFLGRKRVIQLELAEDELPDGVLYLIALCREIGSDPSLYIGKALAMVPGDFWEAKLAELTPLEWKLLDALSDQSFRKDVTRLLNSDQRQY